MILGLVLTFLLAALAPRLHALLKETSGWVFAMWPLAWTIVIGSLAQQVIEGDSVYIRYPWMSQLGVNLSLYVDGLSLLFALLISGIGALVLIYSGSYLKRHRYLGRFYLFILLFMGSMLGLVLSGNLISMFVFWELTSLSSYFLIGFDHEREEARRAALQAMVVTGMGGLALLAGLLLLGQAGGTLEIAALLKQGETLRTSPHYLPALALIVIGAFTKSAQVPFHFWLPNAMEAPTPVSAYLHSATMVKAGIYLLARLSPVLGGTAAWQLMVAGGGLVTMVLGAIMALGPSDLKRILAYSTVSTLGTLTFLIGLGTPLAAKAAMALLLAHAMYKGALFLVAGAVDHEIGIRDVRRLGGLGQFMPVTATAAGMAALSMAGLPPSIGFISKELLYEAQLHALHSPTLLAGTGVLASGLLVAVAGIVGLRPFFGHPIHRKRHLHEPPLSLWLGPLLLGGAGIALAIVPEIAASPLISTAVSAVLGKPTVVELRLWHGPNPSLALSALTVIAGAGFYAAQPFLLDIAARAHLKEWMARWGPQRGYERMLQGLNALATAQTRLLQSGFLRFYLMIIVLTTIALVGSTIIIPEPLSRWLSRIVDARPYELIIVVLMGVATLMAVLTSSRLAAVAALGIVGYGVALLYMLFGAPDLAMTQFAVETLTVILLVLVVYRLPRFTRLSGRSARLRDTALALAAGGMMTALMLMVLSAPLKSRLAPFFAANSLTLAKGRNVVNVILVDFRALDTLGEITVLAVAAIGVYALLKLRTE
ncbi:MAG: putative monovalent cation/H+ antiporter subunit A [Anaerolineae bacterium]|nr:putative monovalent cation/H+ antiporter subunit A [Anaerolineae bacterium]